jgi:hypothetical protein
MYNTQYLHITMSRWSGLTGSCSFCLTRMVVSEEECLVPATSRHPAGNDMLQSENEWLGMNCRKPYRDTWPRPA